MPAPMTGSTQPPARRCRKCCADEDRNGADEVGDDLEVGAFDVAALGGPLAQEPPGDDVGDEADGGRDHDGPRLNVWRLAEAADGFPQDVARNTDEEDGVGQGAEDPEAVEPEAASASGAAAVGEVDVGEGHGEAEDVGGHVAGVGEEGEGAGGDADDDLHDEYGTDDTEGYGETASVACAGAAGSGVVVVVVAAHEARSRPTPGRNRPAREA